MCTFKWIKINLLGIKQLLFIFGVGFSLPLFAHSYNILKLNPGQRNKFIANINNSNKKDWQRMISILHISLPDSLRPLIMSSESCNAQKPSLNYR